MNKEYFKLYDNFLKALLPIQNGPQDIPGYTHAIDLIRAKILELRPVIHNGFASPADEIEFFRHCYPVFYGKLFLYLKMHQWETTKQALPLETHKAIIRKEQRQIARYYLEHAEFIRYYQADSPAIDDLFTRQHSLSRTYDEMSFVIDPEIGTVASYRAAWARAYKEYKSFLDRVQNRLLSPEPTSAFIDKGYTWDSTDADAVEWLAGLESVKAVKYNGTPAGLLQLTRLFKAIFGKEILNPHDRERLLRNRKKQRMSFTQKILTTLEKKWDEADGKFE